MLEEQEKGETRTDMPSSHPVGARGEWQRGSGESGPSEAEELAEKGAGYAERAREQIAAGKDQAAEGMERAAEMVRERTAGMGGMTAEAGTKAAETMERASGYLRQRGAGEVWDDIERYAREHPTQALAGALIAGFLIGRMLR